MADKLTPLILDALARAAAHPAGLALFAGKSEPGLFPAAALGKPASQKALSEGLLHVVRTETSGKTPREIAAATDKGLAFLVEQQSPKQVLDDFVRVLEERRAEVTNLLASAKQMAASLDSMRQVVSAVMPRVSEARVPMSAEPRADFFTADSGGVAVLAPPRTQTQTLADRILVQLRAWTATGTSRDCPLPDLLRGLDPQPTLGQFHDALRRLHDDARVYLHPWTGPLYALPEPAAALMIGHEVAFYASLRTDK